MLKWCDALGFGRFKRVCGVLVGGLRACNGVEPLYLDPNMIGFGFVCFRVFVLLDNCVGVLFFL
jgi:hypothetical protein